MYKNSSLTRKFELIDKMKGLEFEYYVADILKKQGYKRVSVTKATGDFGVDIICTAKKGKDRIAIQVKRYNSPLSGKAIQEVVAGARHYKATRSMVITNSTFTPKAKILAKSNDCELIDRYLLKRWVYENQNIEKKKNHKEVFNNTAVENNNSSIAINPLTPTAQYMNFDDVPFTPEIDESFSKISDTTQEDFKKADAVDIVLTQSEHVTVANEGHFPSASAIESKPLDVESETVTDTQTTDKVTNNQDEILETTEFTLDETIVDNELVLVDAVEENTDEIDYNEELNIPAETINENFFDDL